MIQLDEDIESAKNTMNGLKETNTSYTTEIKQILSHYSDSELAHQIETRQTILANLKSELKKWQDGRIEKISEEKMTEAEKTYNFNKNSLKKIKKISIDIIDVFCEGMEMKRSELMVSPYNNFNYFFTFKEFNRVGTGNRCRTEIAFSLKF